MKEKVPSIANYFFYCEIPYLPFYVIFIAKKIRMLAKYFFLRVFHKLMDVFHSALFPHLSHRHLGGGLELSISDDIYLLRSFYVVIWYNILYNSIEIIDIDIQS